VGGRGVVEEAQKRSLQAGVGGTAAKGNNADAQTDRGPFATGHIQEGERQSSSVDEIRVSQMKPESGNDRTKLRIDPYDAVAITVRPATIGPNPLANRRGWCESRVNMSATIVRAKRQTTLPEDVCQAAGIRIRDQVDWRFQDGEIRGRKLVPAPAKAQTVRPVKFKDLLILPQDIEVDFNRLDQELRAAREERDEQLLG
jgi:bifunctional DNA-binding transcriptional regulator/antitoxin component of YhaV-PrlF toxin-antitoxin module